ncbi:MAG: YebC/PmpR family DNA-binding transcriptional regulator [Patescibacteria group bacterium]|nr:YebC/PmpR family DNA-binding transcriptional regulator [Patescibacteria group bacterium]MDD5490898.1 YebC/PmpR family DNA-binding transcriptional regulator [Patescibacteria group bacterium]
MSGHSKWHNIQQKKGVADKKRGALFSRLAKALTVAAREGGGDPSANFKLRLAVDKAKAANMPKDNIERAIQRGTGEIAGEQIEEIIYEGFGPAGMAIVAVVLTDNRNRTASSIKHLFSKHGGNLGSPNSVLWMFERKGVLRIKMDTVKMPREEFELKLIDLGADDIKEEEGFLAILVPPEKLQLIKESLEKEGLIVDYAEIEWVAKEKISPPPEERERLEQFFEALDEDEDVDNYYSNLKE